MCVAGVAKWAGEDAYVKRKKMARVSESRVVSPE